jgi:hypothetical protein
MDEVFILEHVGHDRNVFDAKGPPADGFQYLAISGS